MESQNLEEKSLTWADVKTLANTLTDEQLKAPVRWWGEERGGVVKSASILDEDHVQSDYCIEPKSAYAQQSAFDPEYDYPVVASKNDPILWVD